MISHVQFDNIWFFYTLYNFTLWFNQREIYSLVKTYVTHSYLLDNIFIPLALSFTDKLWEYRWVQILLLVWQICFCLDMNDILSRLLMMIHKLVLLKLLT